MSRRESEVLSLSPSADNRPRTHAPAYLDRLANLEQVVMLLKQSSQLADAGTHRQLEDVGELLLAFHHLPVSNSSTAAGIDLLLDELQAKVGELEAVIGRANRQAELLTALLQMHEEMVTDPQPMRSRWEWLAEQIIADVDEHQQPMLNLDVGQNLAEAVAIHCLNVASHLAYLANRSWNYRAQRMEFVLAGMTFDIGMRALPDQLWFAGPNLDGRIAAEIRKHPYYSQGVLSKTDLLSAELFAAVADHHERTDGSGYPRQLFGGQISAASHLLAACDIFCARRTRRSYRMPGTHRDTILGMLSDADAGRLDTEAVKLLLHLSVYEIGSTVELSTGELAEVVAPPIIDQDLTSIGTPIVKLIRNRIGGLIVRPTIRNLALEPDVRVVKTVAPAREEATIWPANEWVSRRAA